MGLLDDYDKQAPALQEFSSKLETLLDDLLSAEDLRVHSVATRVKSRSSLEKKLGKEIGKYGELAEVTDLCGARVITYFEDHVDEISRLVESEFEIDRINSIDKRQSGDSDRFGYVSVHYIASLKRPRAELAEYRRFRDIKFELQIRSILQHAWAEIEHDLQYKSQEAIPRELRRRFARLASLLEVGDAEFKGIRDSIEDYQRRVAVAITTTPKEVLVDRDSLEALIREDALIHRLDVKIAAHIGVPVEAGVMDLDFVLGAFSHLRLRTIDEVRSALQGSSESVVRFAWLWLRRDSNKHYPVYGFGRGVSMFYLAYQLILTAYPGDKVAAALTASGFRHHDMDQLAKELLDTQDLLPTVPSDIR